MEHMDTKELIELIKNMGGCEKLDRCKCKTDILDLLFTPQGMEFCSKYKFPNADICRMFKSCGSDAVFIDAEDVYEVNAPRLVIAGSTRANLHYSTCDYRCELIVMDGAQVNVTTSGYGLVFYSLCGGQINIQNTENGKSYAI